MEANNAEKRRERLATQVSGPARVPTQVSGENVNAEVNEVDKKHPVFSRVRSYPDNERFKKEVSGIKTLTGESGVVYEVEKALNTEGGEAVILLCVQPDGKKVVAKVFSHAEGKGAHSLEARDKVFVFMQTALGRKHVLPVIDNGIVGILGDYSHYFEVFPYCEDGDMADLGPMTFEEMLPIIRELNEALKAIHHAGILHLDIKPENLYRYQGRIIIGDFGIARTTEMHHTHTAVGTDGYRAPESLFAPTGRKSAYILNEAADYYSLGVTLASIYEGKFIFADKDDSDMSAAIRDSHLPLTYRSGREHEQLQNLFDGLVQFDVHHRFGSEDVEKWLLNHDYKVKKIELDEKWTKALIINGKSCRSEKEFFDAVTMDENGWEEGGECLFSSDWEYFFRDFRPDLSRLSRKVCEKYQITGDADVCLMEFLRSVYPAGMLAWKGQKWNNLTNLAEQMCDGKNMEFFTEIFQKKIISYWFTHSEDLDYEQSTLKLMKSMEEAALKYPYLIYNWFKFVFSEDAQIEINGKHIENLEEFFGILFQSAKEFYQENGVSERLIKMTDNYELYGFLAGQGYGSHILSTLDRLENQEDFSKLQAVMLLLEVIGESEEINMNELQEFYMAYGPVSVARYIWMLQKESHVYQGVTSDGERLVAEIEKFALPKPDKITVCYNNMKELLKLTEKLRGCLQNNPFLAEAGIYEKAEIVCNDLRGYFEYDFMGVSAPLGMQWCIEASEKKGDERA